MGQEISNNENIENKKPKSNKKIMIGIAILIIAGIIFFVANKQITGNAITGDAINEGELQITQDAEIVKIPLSSISTKAEWHEHDSNGVKVKYFTVKASDGTPKIAFDACNVCYKSRKGYKQQGKDMVCNNCGNHYAIDGLGTKNLKGGGCWPGYLPNSIEGDYFVIKKSDLDKGAYRF